MAKAKIMSNVDLWNKLRALSPTFASHTSEGTAELFTERGFEQIKYDTRLVDEFFDLTLRIYLQLVTTAGAKDPLADQGFGEYFDDADGEIAQRIAIESSKPISPKYRDLPDGPGPDPFVVRKGKAFERFFRSNFDYSSLLTMPDDWTFRRIFLSEDGISRYMAGMMQGLENGYIKQVYLNKLEAINALINSEDYPLQSTQVVDITMSATPALDEMRDFILAVSNIYSAMRIAPSTSAFNSMKFDTAIPTGDLKLLVKPGLANRIRTYLLSQTYNREDLNLPVDIVEVPNFGGLKPVKPGTATQVYPVYNSLGENVGFADTDGASVAQYRTQDMRESSLPLVEYTDPNENVIALLVDKGAVFHTRHNPYTVETIRNPRGMYTNYWVNSPNNAINVDHLYSVVKFTSTPPETE